MAISDKLKHDLTSGMDIERVFQKHVVDGASHVFGIPPNFADEEYELRHDFAVATSTSINDVILVGSAKLGFSVKSTQFSEFDSTYSETNSIRDRSDIDIALVNATLFERVAEEIFHLSRHFDRDWINDKWRTNQFNREPKYLFTAYAEYLTRGWLRPDFMPNDYLDIATWHPVCARWRRRLNRSVSIGIYSNWIYLKYYHMDHLKKLQAKLTTMEII